MTTPVTTTDDTFADPPRAERDPRRRNATAHGRRGPPVTPAPAVAQPVARPARRSGLGAAGAACSAGRHRPALPVGLGRSGWANAFYSAAVQAGTAELEGVLLRLLRRRQLHHRRQAAGRRCGSWRSRRASSASTRGASSCRRRSRASPRSACSTSRCGAGSARPPACSPALVLALTPVATLMFRFNNPDALLVLLLTLGAYAVDPRARERPAAAGSCWPASLVGFGFITKMLQAFLVVPAFALVYLHRRADEPAAPAVGSSRWPAVALLVSAGWWVAIVQLWPAASRPYIGGSQTNSVLELIFGYNGFGPPHRQRDRQRRARRRAARPAAWGSDRLGPPVHVELGRPDRLAAAGRARRSASRCSWLTLPRAAHRPHPRRRAAVGRLRCSSPRSSSASRRASSTSTTRSPWRRRSARSSASARPRSGRGARRSPGDCAFRGIIAATAFWSFVLLDRSPTWHPWLRPVVLVGGLATAALLIVGGRLGRRTALALAGAGCVLAMAGPALYSLQTAATAHSGSLPSAGPTVAGGANGRFAPGGGRGVTAFGSGAPGGANGAGGSNAPSGSNAAGGSHGTGGTGGTGGAPPSFNGAPQGTANGGPGGAGVGTAGSAGFGAAGGAGGLLNASRPSAALVRLLEQNAGRFRWVAATVGAQSAAGYQLATDDPVMSLGGFNGSDPYPTLARVRGAGRRREGALLHRRRHERIGCCPRHRRRERRHGAQRHGPCGNRRPGVERQHLDERHLDVGRGSFHLANGRRDRRLRPDQPYQLELLEDKEDTVSDLRDEPLTTCAGSAADNLSPEPPRRAARRRRTRPRTDARSRLLRRPRPPAPRRA